jgi:L-phenylalanine/L-methionine N-acetyltransferase
MMEPAGLRYGRARMAEDLEIRPFHLDDTDALWRLFRTPGVLETTLSMPSQRIEQRRRQFEQLGDDDHVFVAVRHGEIAGIAALHVGTGRRRHVASLGVMVAVTHRRAGVGDALMRTILDVADRWLGLRRVELGVLTGNQAARRLYEKHGFMPEGVSRQSVAGEGRLQDELRMARLRPPMPADSEEVEQRALAQGAAPDDSTLGARDEATLGTSDEAAREPRLRADGSITGEFTEG